MSRVGGAQRKGRRVGLRPSAPRKVHGSPYLVVISFEDSIGCSRPTSMLALTTYFVFEATPTE